jgi:hypothetical protein
MEENLLPGLMKRTVPVIPGSEGATGPKEPELSRGVGAPLD